MPRSIKPDYYRVGSTGEHQLYPVVKDDECKPTFSFDNLDVEDALTEHAAYEAELGVLTDEEAMLL